MRERFRVAPAQQLKSVAMRYRMEREASRRGSGRWFGPIAAEDPQDRDIRGSDRSIRDAKMQRLEAVLFLAREPLSSRKLSEYVNLADGTEARTLVRRLNGMYDVAGRAFRVEEVAGGFQLLSRPKFASWLRRLQHVPAEVRLSAPVLETLAVIAYRQPVLRADIEAIRGVNCGEILRQLMDRDLVRISGRSQELGRPYLYATTKKFLQIFGLSNIDRLPHVETMRNISQDGANPHPAEQQNLGEQQGLGDQKNLGGPQSDRPRLGAGDAALKVSDANGTQKNTDHFKLTRQMEESEVTATMQVELPHADFLDDQTGHALAELNASARDVRSRNVRARDDDDDFEDDEDDDLDEDEDDELDDDEIEDDEIEEEIDDDEIEEDELDDDELEDDELEEDELDDDELDEDFDDEEWEEVEEDDDEEEDDEDWDDDDDDLDDWGDEEEEEEEEEWD